MIRAYKYQLDPNETQKAYFAKCFGACRWIYNRSLARRVEVYKNEGKNITAYDLIKEITPLKASSETNWLTEVPAQSLGASVLNMENAFIKFFKEKRGFPVFKNKSGRQSFQVRQNFHVNFEDNKIKIPKIGWVRAFVHRECKGELRNATISKSVSGKYFISIIVSDGIELPQKAAVNELTAVGIDVGLKTFATLSSGQQIDNPRYLERSMERLKVLQCRASKKTKASNRRKRANMRVAQLHYKISNQRKDFLHKATSQIIRENQTIIIEDLNVDGMLKNHCLAKAISSASWSEFFRQLEYKSEWSGRNMIRIGRFQPSSRMCTCGVVNKELTLKDRTWTCKKCNATHDRDLLAANNIKAFGLRNSGAESPGEDVEALRLRKPVKRQGNKAISQVNKQ